MRELTAAEVTVVSGGMGGNARRGPTNTPRLDSVMGGMVGGGISGVTGGVWGLVIGAVGGMIGGAMASCKLK